MQPEFLKAHGIKQTEIATALGVDKAYVNRLTKPDANPTRQTIDATLDYLSRRLGRTVTYEEAFLESTASGGRHELP